MSDEQKIRAFEQYYLENVSEHKFVGGTTCVSHEYGRHSQTWQASQAEAAKEIERLKSDREAEMQGLWRVIEGQREDIARLERIINLHEEVLSWAIHHYPHPGISHVDYRVTICHLAENAISAAEKECAKC